MNTPVNQNPPMAKTPPMNQTQRPTVATISAEPRMQDVDVAIVSRGGTMTGNDGPWPQVQLFRNNKVTFDIVTKKETFFETRDVIG